MIVSLLCRFLLACLAMSGSSLVVVRRFIPVMVLNLLFAFEVAFAQGGSDGDSVPSWEFGGGIGSLYLPDYHGSDEYRGFVFPVPYIVHRGNRLRIDDAGVTGKLLSSDAIKIDVSGGAGMPVNRNSKARSGMEPLNPTVEFGPLATFLLSGNTDENLTLNLAVREVLSVSLNEVADRGFVMAPYLKYDIKNSTRWDHFTELYISISPTFGSARYHQYYYGVTTEYVTDSRPAFTASAGYQGTRATVTYKIRQDRRWWGGFLQYELLNGAVFRQSSLVKSERFFAAGLATSWVAISR